MADSLVSRNADQTAAPEVRWPGRSSRQRRGRRVGVQHAESTFRCAPNLPCRGVDQFVLRVMPEVIVVVASGEFVQTIIRGHMNVGVAEVDVGVADVRRGYGEANNFVITRSDASFLNTTETCFQIFVADHPLLAEIRTDDEVREAGRVGRLLVLGTCGGERKQQTEPEREMMWTLHESPFFVREERSLSHVPMRRNRIPPCIGASQCC